MISKMRQKRLKVQSAMNNEHSELSTTLLINEFSKSLFIGVLAVLLTSLGFYMAISGLVVIFLEFAL
jgi:hypothetical protein